MAVKVLLFVAPWAAALQNPSHVPPQDVASVAPASAAQNPAPSGAELGCCYRIGYGSRMVPCCLDKDKGMTQDQCLGKQRGALLGGAIGWRTECPDTAAEAAAWIKGHDLSPAAADEGCCFAIGYGAMMKPCCLKTEAGPPEKCEANDNDSQARVGGASGWAKPCPKSAKDAASILATDKLNSVDARLSTLEHRSGLLMTTCFIGFGVLLALAMGAGVFYMRSRRPSVYSNELGRYVNVDD